MVLALHVVVPPAHAEERLIRSEELLGLLRVDKANRVQQVDAIRLLLQLHRFQLADRPETLRDLRVVRTRRGLGEYRELPIQVLHELLYALFTDGSFLKRKQR